MTAPLTNDYLRELIRLRAAGTPGEWRACGAHEGECSCGLVWSVTEDDVLLQSFRKTENGERPREQAAANMRLVAAAVNDIRPLVEEVKALRSLVAGLSSYAVLLLGDLDDEEDERNLKELAKEARAALQRAMGIGGEG